MNLSDYIDLYRQIKNKDHEDMKKVKIAVLRSFTCEQIESPLGFECFNNGIYCDIEFGGYNQYIQEILNKESFLYKYNPDVIILAVRLQELCPDFYCNYIDLKSDVDDVINKILDDFINLISVIKENFKANIFINNFSIPCSPSSGIYDFNNKYGQVTMIRKLNLMLVEKLSNIHGTYIVDVEQVENVLGKANIEDMRMWYISKNPYKFEFYIKLAKEYVKFIKAVYGLKKKCVVLDLDNTLWGGIVGEDGFDNIKLGDTYPGKCYKDFQQKLLNLSKRGVLLAVNSKNNYEDAIDVINNHPDMVLREKDFACIKINWSNKAINIEQISKELNIGLDSMVFIDDNPAECELVKKSFEEVEVINLPKSPILYSKIIDTMNLFETLDITEEDLNKNDMYKSQIKREKMKISSVNLEEYYRNLNMQMEIKKADNFAISRIAQLTQKTNQFNLTTKRYTEETIRQLIEDNKYGIYYIRVVDKFGDNGITGAAIIEKVDSDQWYIDTFLLSCRIMNRNIESAFMGYLYNQAVTSGVKEIIGEYIPTKKNKIVENFYLDLGFEKLDERFILDINAKVINMPEYIEIL